MCSLSPSHGSLFLGCARSGRLKTEVFRAKTCLDMWFRSKMKRSRISAPGSDWLWSCRQSSRRGPPLQPKDDIALELSLDVQVLERKRESPRARTRTWMSLQCVAMCRCVYVCPAVFDRHLRSRCRLKTPNGRVTWRACSRRLKATLPICRTPFPTRTLRFQFSSTVCLSLDPARGAAHLERSLI
jgi:hypothetical protein